MRDSEFTVDVEDVAVGANRRWSGSAAPTSISIADPAGTVCP